MMSKMIFRTIKLWYAFVIITFFIFSSVPVEDNSLREMAEYVEANRYFIPQTIENNKCFPCCCNCDSI